MNDDLDLRVLERHHEADPQYREALRQRVAAILEAGDSSLSDHMGGESPTVELATERSERHRRRWVLSAADVVAAAAAVIAVIVGLSSGDETLSPADVSVRTTQPSVAETVPATDSPMDETGAVVEPTPVSVPPRPTPDGPELFVDLAAGAMVDLPDVPLGPRHPGTVVWTGTEMILWGGSGADGELVDDGAAFNPVDGTWRVIAEAPIGPRSQPNTVWTGTEVIVWRGSTGDDAVALDGAAYNPTTDSWRLLPAVPDDVGSDTGLLSMVWTGNEAVVVGDGAAVAYDPVVDNWRSLANPPPPGYYETAVWTGDSIVLADDTRMVHSVLIADRWSTVDIGSSATMVGIPGSDGIAGTFVNLPTDMGAPVQLLDETGTAIAELPAFAGDTSLFGDQVNSVGLWAGDEAIFWIWAADGVNGWPEQVWALNPRTQSWRQLDADTAFPYHAHGSVAVAGDVLMMWGTPGRGDPARGVPASSSGVAYRVGATPAD